VTVCAHAFLCVYSFLLKCRVLSFNCLIMLFSSPIFSFHKDCDFFGEYFVFKQIFARLCMYLYDFLFQWLFLFGELNISFSSQAILTLIELIVIVVG
jgi:hypothetical protein